jgi:A/G-specific adenine glycosylase
LILRRHGDRILLQRRSDDQTLMPGMWELPQYDRAIRREPLLVVKHSITTTDWRVQVFAGTRMKISKDMRWVTLRDVAQFPLTGLTRKILHRLNLLA